MVAWLDTLPDETIARFVVAGLVNAREKRKAARVTVAAFADAYCRTPNGTPSIQSNRVPAGCAKPWGLLQGHSIADVTAGDCDDFGRWLATEARTLSQVERKGAALSPATCGKRLQLASTIFGDSPQAAADSGEPVSLHKKPGAANPDRQRYVPAATVETLIEAEAEPGVATAAGVGVTWPWVCETTSEPFSLTWDCIDWEEATH